MSLLDRILEQDKELFIYLNGLGTPQWDHFWLLVTDKINWIPLYIILLYVLFKKFGFKRTLFILLLIGVLVFFTDQSVNLIKYATHRLRPNHEPQLDGIIRVVKNTGGYSFVSGHATNAFAVSTFFIYLLQRYSQFIYLILIWPFLFLYSRIYLGVHYPLDVLTGMLLGVIIGRSFYFLYQKFFLTPNV